MAIDKQLFIDYVDLRHRGTYNMTAREIAEELGCQCEDVQEMRANYERYLYQWLDVEP